MATLLIAVVTLALLCVCAFAESGQEYDLEPITDDIFLLSDPAPLGVTDGITMNVSTPATIVAGEVGQCIINCSLSGSTLASFVAVVQVDDADRVKLPQFVTEVAEADYPPFLTEALPEGSTIASVYSMREGEHTIYKVVLSDGSQRLVMFDVAAGSTLNIPLQVQPANGVFKPGETITLHPSYYAGGELVNLDEVSVPVTATLDWDINKNSAIQKNGTSSTNIGKSSDFTANDTTITYTITSDNVRNNQNGTIFAQTVTIEDTVAIQHLDFPASAADFTCATEGTASNLYYNGALLYSLSMPDVTIEPVITDGKLTAIHYSYTRPNPNYLTADLPDETITATLKLGNGNFTYTGTGEPTIANSVTQNVTSQFPTEEVPADVDTKTITDKGSDYAEITKQPFKDAECTIPLAPGEDISMDEPIFYKVHVQNYSDTEQIFGVYDAAGANMTVPGAPENPANKGQVYDSDDNPVTYTAAGEKFAGGMRYGNLYIWNNIKIPAGGHFDVVLQTKINPLARDENLDNNIYLFDNSLALSPGMPGSVLNSSSIDRDSTHQLLLNDGVPVAGITLDKKITSYDSETGAIAYQLIFSNTTNYPVISGAVDTWPSQYIQLTGVDSSSGQRYRVVTLDGVTYDSKDYPHDGYTSPLDEMTKKGQTLDKVTLLNTVIPAKGSVTVDLTGLTLPNAPSSVTNVAAFGSGGSGDGNPGVEASVVLIHHAKSAYHATMNDETNTLEMGDAWTDHETGGVEPDANDYVAWEIMVENISNFQGTYRVEDFLPAGLLPADDTQVVLIRTDRTNAETPLGIGDAVTNADTGVTTLYTNTFTLAPVTAKPNNIAYVRIYTKLTQDAIDAALLEDYVAKNTACVQAQRVLENGDIAWATATEDTASILLHNSFPRYLTISKDFNRCCWWEEQANGSYILKAIHEWMGGSTGGSTTSNSFPGAVSLFPITLQCTQNPDAPDVPIYRVVDKLPAAYEYMGLQAFNTALTNTNKANMCTGNVDKAMPASVLIGTGSKTLTVGSVEYTYTVNYDATARILEITFQDALGNPLELNDGEVVQIIVAARCIKYYPTGSPETNNVCDIVTDKEVIVNEINRNLYGDEIANSSHAVVGTELSDGQSAFSASEAPRIFDYDVGIDKKATRYRNGNGDFVNITATNQPTLGSVVEWVICVVATTPVGPQYGNYFPIENYSVTDVIPEGFELDTSYPNTVYFGPRYDFAKQWIIDNDTLGYNTTDNEYHSPFMTKSSSTKIVPLVNAAQQSGQTLTWNLSGYTQAQHFAPANQAFAPATVIRYYTKWTGTETEWRYGAYTNNAKVVFADDSYVVVKDNVLPGIKNTADNSAHDSDTLSLYGAYGTASRKAVSVVDSEGATVEETDCLQATNYVTSVDVEGNARFMLEVTNKSAGGGPFSEFAVVDFLPQIGDAGVISSAQRGSVFEMQLASPNFTVQIVPKVGDPITVPSTAYNVLFASHTAGNQAAPNDFYQTGTGSIDWHSDLQAGDSAFSLRIDGDFLALEENHVLLDSKVQISFDARIEGGKTVTVGAGEDAHSAQVWPVAGDTAYNSFGYYYAIAIEGGAQATGQAEPSMVGVRIHDATIDVTKAPLGNISAEHAQTLPPFSFIIQDTLHRDPVTGSPLPVVGAKCYLLDESGNETGEAVLTDEEGRISVAAGSTWRVHPGYGEYRVVEDVQDPFSLVSVKTDNANPGYVPLADVTADEMAAHGAYVELESGHAGVKTEFANTTVADFQIGKTVSGSLGDTDLSYTVKLRADAVEGANEAGDTITGEITGPNRTPGAPANAITIALGQWNTFTLNNGEMITLNDLPLTTPLYAAEILPDYLLDAEHSGDMQVGLVAGGVGVVMSSDADAWDAAIGPLLLAHRSDPDYSDWETFAEGRGAIYSICFDPVEAEEDLPQLENYLQINNLIDTPAPTGVRPTVWPYALLLAIAGAGLVLTRRKKRQD